MWIIQVVWNFFDVQVIGEILSDCPKIRNLICDLDLSVLVLKVWLVLDKLYIYVSLLSLDPCMWSFFLLIIFCTLVWIYWTSFVICEKGVIWVNEFSKIIFFFYKLGIGNALSPLIVLTLLPSHTLSTPRLATLQWGSQIKVDIMD